MKITEVISTIKKYHRGCSANGTKIYEDTTKDRILYGNGDQECTGIVTTCFASAYVIRQAAQHHANLIISHEALFWNHGDHQDWLADNTVYQDKAKLLDEYGITVWRDHDYIHSGIPVENGWADGIFYGFTKIMGWESNLIGDMSLCTMFQFDGRSARSIAQEMMEKMQLKGMRVYGDPDTAVHKAWVPFHIFGPEANDNGITARTEHENIDLLLPLEVHDYTTAEYMRDASLLGHGKAMVSCGHFNMEEPGMEYMTTWLPSVIHDIPVFYVQSGDSYSYLLKQ